MQERIGALHAPRQPNGHFTYVSGCISCVTRHMFVEDEPETLMSRPLAPLSLPERSCLNWPQRSSTSQSSRAARRTDNCVLMCGLGVDGWTVSGCLMKKHGVNEMYAQP
jgi:hypothetical protein